MKKSLLLFILVMPFCIQNVSGQITKRMEVLEIGDEVYQVLLDSTNQVSAIYANEKGIAPDSHSNETYRVLEEKMNSRKQTEILFKYTFNTGVYELVSGEWHEDGVSAFRIVEILPILISLGYDLSRWPGE